ncbi:hypothetical protein C8R44DRAFT_760919 [Mycena epipterygia]|nr:hypothetical protein C8R44DRAFT_760919 [Mycena epipterygia]
MLPTPSYDCSLVFPAHRRFHFLLSSHSLLYRHPLFFNALLNRGSLAPTLDFPRQARSAARGQELILRISTPSHDSHCSGSLQLVDSLKIIPRCAPYTAEVQARRAARLQIHFSLEFFCFLHEPRPVCHRNHGRTARVGVRLARRVSCRSRAAGRAEPARAAFKLPSPGRVPLRRLLVVELVRMDPRVWCRADPPHPLGRLHIPRPNGRTRILCSLEARHRQYVLRPSIIMFVPRSRRLVLHPSRSGRPRCVRGRRPRIRRRGAAVPIQRRPCPRRDARLAANAHARTPRATGHNRAELASQLAAALRAGLRNAYGQPGCAPPTRREVALLAVPAIQYSLGGFGCPSPSSRLFGENPCAPVSDRRRCFGPGIMIGQFWDSSCLVGGEAVRPTAPTARGLNKGS